MLRTDKVVVVTGGAQGLGEASCRLFAEKGYFVVVADMNFKKASELKTVLLDKGYRAMAIGVDVSDYTDCRNAVDVIVDKLGTIDILINNAGITRDKSFKKMSPAMWQKVIDVNLTGIFNMTHNVIPHMVEHGFGRIINTSSVVRDGAFGQANYAATKSGVIGLTKTIAIEYGTKGITANAVAPGYIMTDMTAAMPPEVLENMRQQVFCKQLGEPIDVANAYLFLASDDAKYINGTVIEVNGGMR